MGAKFPHSKATSWESSADYMASWRPAVDLEAAASAADEDELTWRSRRETSLGGGFKYLLFSPLLGEDFQIE